MELQEKEYREFDYLTVLVKREKIDDVTSAYKIFLWEVVSVDEHDRFGDILILNLKRKHKIEGKEKLQYLQVKYESLLNEAAKLEAKKHVRSMAFGITFGILLGIVFALGITIAVKAVSSIALFGGVALSVISLIIDIVFVLYIKRLVARENSVFEQRNKGISVSIAKICTRARIR